MKKIYVLRDKKGMKFYDIADKLKIHFTTVFAYYKYYKQNHAGK